jgi:dTDP-4-dehydrorhamnose 3,5-epimerase
VPFEFQPLAPNPDVVVVTPRVHRDERGWFLEWYKKSDFTAHGIVLDFVQHNHSRSTAKGVLRGLHYQNAPMAQGKLVRCTYGEIFDVAVDIRRGSPNYGRWVSARLSAQNGFMLWVPPGFAHGFVTLSDVAEVLYSTTAEYSAELDRTIRWNDPAIGVDWPTKAPTVSTRDANAPLLADADHDFVWKRSDVER